MFPVNDLIRLNMNAPDSAHKFALALFEKARQTAGRKKLLATLRPAARQMWTLCNSLVQADHYEGVQVVRLSDIKGSENRVEDFDIDFYPLKEHLEARWVRVAMGMHSGVPLPLVELIEMDGVYYVRDGHHRISVAHALGYETVEAVVTRYKRAA